ncbi:hypothetical protein A8709_25260 [Paenibacillus pectinilyticus]|uniref:DUF5658 domain-containing protein n=1 Tax=Paenibacillus pectinilyticus TaxID=512399 RepID=A0A1C1A0T3_9BACL|nr:DUF5658 family protein [Paenibacillus pectinilyticus]OCT14156.1 hypothetical protein A8709_25260 [Paenibacillus pectinilyticus]
MSRTLIIFLCIASLLDAGLTDMGLRMQLIGEANPIMAFLYEHSYLAFYGIKIILPLSLFFIATKVGKRVLINNLFRFSTVVYMGILLLHTYWISTSLSHSLNI